MGSHHHNSSDHVSRLDIPCLLYGTVGIGLALAMHAVGLLKRGDDWLLGVLFEPVFHGVMPSVLSLPVLILAAAVFCYALAFVVLDTVGTGRRAVIGVTVLVLVLAMVPTLAVWNIYCSPFLIVVGVFWTWFCTMMYVSQYLMPCDVAHAAQVPPSILTVSSAYKTPPVSEEKEEEGDRAVEDQDKKYQPKNRNDQKRVNGKEKMNG